MTICHKELLHIILVLFILIFSPSYLSLLLVKAQRLQEYKNLQSSICGFLRTVVLAEMLLFLLLNAFQIAAESVCSLRGEERIHTFPTNLKGETPPFVAQQTRQLGGSALLLLPLGVTAVNGNYWQTLKRGTTAKDYSVRKERNIFTK